jgi:hypothetical protein
MVCMAPLRLASQLDDSDVWAGWPRFLPRLNLLDHSQLAATPTAAFAKPMLQAGLDRQLVIAARREPPTKVLLEPEAWRNQRPKRDRHTSFSAMGALSLPGVVQPELFRNDDARNLVRYAELFYTEQQTRGSSVVITPSHQTGGHGMVGREGELRLTQASVVLARRAGWLTRGDEPKPLLVGITIDATMIGDSHAALLLARSYAELDCDGYWVQLAHLTETAPPARVSSAATFLFALQGLSGRRVFAVDCKNLTWALLAAGLSSACIGAAGRAQFDGPEAFDPTPRKVQHTVFHPTLMRSFQAKSDHARVAFAQFPCSCETHTAGVVPQGKAAIDTHATTLRMSMADAASGPQAEMIVRNWLTAAGWAASDLSVDGPPVGAYEAVFSAATEWRDAAASA